MKTIILILLAYTAVLSLLSVIFCLYDKRAAKKHPKSRVPERALFSLSALGGSFAMLACMLLIRHKTKHKRFMIGIPLIILLQIGLLALGVYAFYRFDLQGYLPAGF
ncbi:MAG: DUF1294 domain-containing protein [Clostridia bacterium]|nr:DUF1294 domain-containing protein [Clostridia bacterium]